MSYKKGDKKKQSKGDDSDSDDDDDNSKKSVKTEVKDGVGGEHISSKKRRIRFSNRSRTIYIKNQASILVLYMIYGNKLKQN